MSRGPVPPSRPGQDPVLMELRPDRTTVLRGVGGRAAIVIPLVVALALTQGRSAGLAWFLWAVLGAAIVVLVVFTVNLTRSGMTVTTRSVVVRRAFGAPRTIPRTGVVRGVLANRYKLGFNPEAPMIVLLGTDRTVLARLSGQYYQRSVLHELVGTLHPTVFDVLDEPITPAEFDRRFPELLPLYERKPGLIVTLVLLVIFLPLVVWVVVATS
jgi:hypothetical protein